MTNPLRTPQDYELFLYTLSDRYSSIRRATHEADPEGHPVFFR